MEQVVFPNPKVLTEMKKFVLVELFTDGKSPQDAINNKLRTEMTGSTANPAYVVLKPTGEIAAIHTGWEPDVDEWLKWLGEAYRAAK